MTITRGQWLAIATVVEQRFGPRHSLTIACWTAYDQAPSQTHHETVDTLEADR